MAAISKDDLLFHPAHGLCRVSAITVTPRTKELVYDVLPITRSQTKVRYVIAASALENSGFGKPISSAEGLAILEYFRTKRTGPSKASRAWKFAELISTESVSKETVKDIKRRQRMNEAVKGLAAELAHVLGLSLQESIERIQKNLGRETAINPLVLNALTNVGKEC